MALAIFQGIAFLTGSGSPALAPLATVEVRRESDNGLASIFSDEAGTASLSNPMTASSTGEFAFYVVGIDRGYKVTITKAGGGETKVLRNVAVGKASQIDSIPKSFRNVAANGFLDYWFDQVNFAPNSGDTTAERWTYRKIGTMSHAIRRSTDVPSVAIAGRRFQFSMEAEINTAQSSLGAGDFAYLGTYIAGADAAVLHERQFSITFCFRSSKTGVYCVSVGNNLGGVSGAAYVGEFTISAANTWQKKTVTVTAITPGSGTWNFDETNQFGMVVRFCLGSGATFQGAASTWIIGSGQKIATSSQVNSCDTAGALVRVAGLQIEPGAATEYDFVDSDTEIRRCLRWREVLQASSNNFISHAQCIGTTLAIATVQFKNYAPFHFPTLILTAANTFEVMSANNTPITLTAIALELVSANGWEVRCTVASGLVAGNATRLRGGVAGGGKVIITYEQNSLFQPG